MPDYTDLRKNNAFLTDYMYLAKQAEYDKYCLYSLRRSLEEAQKTIEDKISSINGQIDSRKQDINNLQRSITSVEVKPSEIGSLTLFIAAPILIIYLLLRQILVQIGIIPESPDFFVALIPFVAVVIILPLFIAYRLRLASAEKEKNEKIRQLSNEIQDKKNEIKKLDNEIRTIEKSELDGAGTCLLYCHRQIRDYEKDLDYFYRFNFLGSRYRDLIAVTEIFFYLKDKTCYTIEGPDGAQNHFDKIYVLNQINDNISGLRVNVLNLTNLVSIGTGQGPYYYGGNIQIIQRHLAKEISAADSNAEKLTEPFIKGGSLSIAEQKIKNYCDKKMDRIENINVQIDRYLLKN